MTHLVDEPTTKRCFAAINAKHDAAEESENAATAASAQTNNLERNPEIYREARELYEEALSIAHGFISEGLIYPLDELIYRLNLGLCCKRCQDWLAAETHYKECLRLVSLAPPFHPHFTSFARDLKQNLNKLNLQVCTPLGAKAASEMAVGMKTGAEESERLRLRGNFFSNPEITTPPYACTLTRWERYSTPARDNNNRTKKRRKKGEAKLEEKTTATSYCRTEARRGYHSAKGGKRLTTRTPLSPRDLKIGLRVITAWPRRMIDRAGSIKPSRRTRGP